MQKDITVMERSFKEAVQHRRSYYSISNTSNVSDKQLEEIINFAVEYVPSAFDSQSTRVVLLLGDNHNKLWDMTKDALRDVVPQEAFSATEQKIDSFRAGYGTILYFEDQDVIVSLQEKFELYAHNFPIWSQQTSAMHQFTIWTMLEDVGLGASLQHYNELIEQNVSEHWQLPSSWKMMAQMPFGTPVVPPTEKIIHPVKDKVLVF